MGAPGAIIFDALSTSSTPVSVSTLGIWGAVLLIGSLSAAALHALRKHQHTFAVLAGLGAVLGATLTISGVSTIHAVSVQMFTVGPEDLRQEILFDCTAPAEFTNTTSSAIFVSDLTLDEFCEINTADFGGTTCIVSDPPTPIAPDESCRVERDFFG